MAKPNKTPTHNSYTCPHCGRVSHNPGDVANKYCVACHKFEEHEGADYPEPKGSKFNPNFTARGRIVCVDLGDGLRFMGPLNKIFKEPERNG